MYTTLSQLGVKIRATNPKILLLLYPNQELLCKAHLRIQEYYESPYFKGKTFTTEEFIAHSTRGGKAFTYHTDMHGFNAPSSILEPFFDGQFDPLSLEEQALVSFLKSIPEEFYLIATHIDSTESANIVRHELSHALWFLEEDYKTEAKKILERYALETLFDQLRKLGYDDQVLFDELVAHAIEPLPAIKEIIPKELSRDMRELFFRFFPREELEKYTLGFKEN